MDYTREVMVTTDGRILVKGEKGIIEITDQEFLKYIKQGMALKKVELDGPAEYTANAAYESAIRPCGSCDTPTPQENEIVGDPVNHPKHYCSHPSGIECIAVARHYDFAIGNAMKYLWRHGLKNEEGKDDIDKSIEDLEKAIWYIRDEIQMLENEKKDKQAKAG
jgi:hypothetical protein